MLHKITNHADAPLYVTEAGRMRAAIPPGEARLVDFDRLRVKPEEGHYTVAPATGADAGNTPILESPEHED